jgi:protocatechuate 3,4-dioxygenase beta subunit
MSCRAAIAATLALVLASAGCGAEETGRGEETAMRQAAIDDSDGGCDPSPADALGPFYEPGAPVRDDVGDGYELIGHVRAASDCGPVGDARVEIWLVNSEGRYDDAHRATVPVDAHGDFDFESNAPVAYEGRPPHIHLRVTASGLDPFVTQHYPQAGDDRARIDITMPSD